MPGIFYAARTGSESAASNRKTVAWEIDFDVTGGLGVNIKTETNWNNQGAKQIRPKAFDRYTVHAAGPDSSVREYGVRKFDADTGRQYDLGSIVCRRFLLHRVLLF